MLIVSSPNWTTSLAPRRSVPNLLCLSSKIALIFCVSRWPCNGEGGLKNVIYVKGFDAGVFPSFNIWFQVIDEDALLVFDSKLRNHELNTFACLKWTCLTNVEDVPVRFTSFNSAGLYRLIEFIDLWSLNFWASKYPWLPGTQVVLLLESDRK